VTFICPACREKGLLSEACRHRKDAVPSWNSVEKMQLIKAMLMEDGEAQFQMETLGINPTDNRPECFDPIFVRRMFEKKPVEIRDTIRYLLLTVDPAAGSDHSDKRHSDYVFMTVAYPGNIIMAVDALDVIEPQDYEAQLIDHIKRVRGLPHTEDAKLVINVESGTGLEAGHIRRLVKDYFGEDNIICMTNQRRKPGMVTSEVTKARGVDLLRQHLGRDEIKFMNNVITSHNDPKKLLKGDFQRQVLDFKKIVTPRQNGTNSVRYSGKEKDKKDDLIMSLLLGLVAADDFFRNLVYYSEKHK